MRDSMERKFKKQINRDLREFHSNTSKATKRKYNEEHLRYIMLNSNEMSVTEMALHLEIEEKTVISMCSKRGFTYFSENAMNWKRKGYKAGTNGYAMYPHKGTYRESASVQNSMLEGE